MSAIADGKVVMFHYTLKNDAGEILDSSSGGDPMPYLHGAQNIVPGLERQMAGKAAGAKFQAVVPPEEGYGVREGDPQEVPRQAFPPDVELAAGMQFLATDESGEQVPVWIAKVSPDKVWVDQNHPLSDVTLHFDVEVVSIRDATAEEVAHGHPHMPGHHHH
jgi:FKBP-type peptidyl-prolyl cis-trans isomerase SlyD